MPLFFIPEIESSKLILSEEESHHIIKVLRLKVGDSIELTDGKGIHCNTRISEINKRTVSIDILDRTRVNKERNYNLHIAIAPTKNIDRFEWFLEKATEIGIDTITPLITANSERERLRFDRLEKVIIAAMKQSLKAYKPQLLASCLIADFLQKKHPDYQLFIAYCGDISKNLFKEEYHKGKNVVIMIGPEGDFSKDEIVQAIHSGYKPVSFGGSRLRTETAGIVACQSSYLINQ